MPTSHHTEQALSTNESTPWRDVSGDWKLTIAAFGDGTAKVQVRDGSSGTTVDVPNASYTADTDVVLTFGVNQQARVTLTGGSSFGHEVSWAKV